jgi:hypothetical protein
MEDLFRRASAKYPLRTDSADWDRLSAALDKDPGPPSDTDKDDKRRRRGIFWWWLLLPLAVGAGIYGWRASVRPSTHLSKAATQTQGAVTQTGGTQEAGTSTGATQGSVAQGGVTQGGVAQGGTTQGETPTQAGDRPPVERKCGDARAGETEKAGEGDETGATGEHDDDGGEKTDGINSREDATGRATARTGDIGGGNVTSDDLFDAADKNITGIRADTGTVRRERWVMGSDGRCGCDGRAGARDANFEARSAEGSNRREL